MTFRSVLRGNGLFSRNLKTAHSNVLELLIVKRSYSSSKNFMAYNQNTSRILAVQRAQQRIKTKNSNHVPSIVRFQIIGNGALGIPRSVCLETDINRYLFNCGEGTQRLCQEHKIKIIKLEHVFVTSAKWNNLGGLIGMLLTLSNIGVPEVIVHGPKGTVQFFEVAKNFAPLHNIKVTEAQCTKKFKDNVMSVEYVPITKPPKNSLDRETPVLTIDKTDYYAHEINSNGKRTVQSIQNIAKKERLDSKLVGKPVTGAMCYICKLNGMQGKLNVEKCFELGIPTGPLLGKLKSGEDITLPDGTVVRSTDVTDPPVKGVTFMVVECPSEEYLDIFINNRAFKKYQFAEDENDSVFCVIHFTPKEVMNNEGYQNWMKKFSPKTHHTIINATNCSLSSEAIHRMQHQLHLLHPEIFPILPLDETNETENLDNINNVKDPFVHNAEAGHIINLRPQQNYDLSQAISITPKEYIQEILDKHGFLNHLAEHQTNISAIERTLTDITEYPKVIFLGTGSSIPCKNRNTSGILIHVDDSTSVILDCGEDTVGQIIRFYGKSKANNIFSNIKAIFISHLHADHHIGLIGVLEERKKYTNEKLFLIAPDKISSWLQLYDKCFEPILDHFVLVSNKDLTLYGHRLHADIKLNLYNALKVSDLNTVPVRHCPFSFGVSLNFLSGKKIVYSGDTRPSDSLVELGKDCDLLIHEATMEDALATEAKIKFHSTWSEAIDVGNQMRARFIMLTHFSQRYSKIPNIPDKFENLKNVGIAYDNMQLSFSHLAYLPHFYPLLKEMFSEHYAMLQERNVKRQKNNERNRIEINS